MGSDKDGIGLPGDATPANSTGAISRPAGRTVWLLLLILVLGVGLQAVRISQVVSKNGDVPFLSANDRSRWCTISALCTNGSYLVDDLIFSDEPSNGQKRKRTNWYTIDLVRHRASDGQLHYYSSKPPLLPTLYAGVYCTLRSLTSWTLQDRPFLVARTILLVVNLLPWALFSGAFLLWLRRRNLSSEDQESISLRASSRGTARTSTWASIVLASMLAFGTFLSTFCNTLNNHLPAAMAVGVSLWCLDRILLREDRRWQWFLLCGLCTSFGAANELPALAWVAAAGAMLLLVSPVKFALGYVPALLPVAVAFFGLNYLAHEEWKPAYAHRDAGKLLFVFDFDAEQSFISTESITAKLEGEGIQCSDSCEIRQARRELTYEFLDPESAMQYALIIDVESSEIAVHEWGDWYDYPGSYWAGEKQGVDKGEPSRGLYILHSLIGHHGILSLTPFWLISLFGAWIVVRTSSTLNFLRDHRLMLVLAILATSTVVIGFYFARGIEDRNYGGVTSGFRWTFWLIPFWCWLASIGLPSVRSSLGRRLVEVTVLLSVFSAMYPWENPWTTPWPMQLMEYAGWL